jgi:Initiator Replication protein
VKLSQFSFHLLQKERTMAKRQKKDSTGLSVPSAQDGLEFRKTNEAIGLRIREGRLSLLSRKLFNVMVYNAQQSQLGNNAPVESEVNKKYFWIPLANVARDAAYDSNDTELLKQHIEQFQNIKLHMEDERQWTSERLVSSVKLVNASGLNNRGGAVWLGYAFPPEVFELVMNPGTYTKLSIYYQGMLCSGPALALYEICRRYATNPSKKTGIKPYDYWFGALTGNPVQDTPTLYKYFKRDVLKPAIAEINSVTDIEVQLIEHKRGRRVEQLQFEVIVVKQLNLKFPVSPVINSVLMSKIQSIGFGIQEAMDICAVHNEQKIQETIDMVQSRITAPNSPPLDSPIAYFRWALKNNNTMTIQLLSNQPKKNIKSSKHSSPMEQFLSARAKDAVNVYTDLPSTEAHQVMDRFKEHPQNPGIKIQKGLENPMVRSLFGRWYAQDLWGEPTDDALSRFMQNNTIDV